MDLQLDGQVALVVGGAGYIGSAVTARLRAEGATVVVASRSGVPGDPDAVVMDAQDAAAVKATVAGILATHGRLDALVVTAAPSARTLDPAKSADPEAILGAVAAKALSFLRVAAEVVPAMRERGYGRIVGISGQNALITGSIVGSLRNAATVVIAKNLADDLAGTGVLVNAVNPGIVTDDPSPDVAPGRPGDSTPQQIADLVAFLASPLCGLSGESIATGHRVRGVVSY